MQTFGGFARSLAQPCVLDAPQRCGRVDSYQLTGHDHCLTEGGSVATLRRLVSATASRTRNSVRWCADHHLAGAAVAADTTMLAFARTGAATGHLGWADRTERHEARADRCFQQSATRPRPHSFSLRHSIRNAYPPYRLKGCDAAERSCRIFFFVGLMVTRHIAPGSAFGGADVSAARTLLAPIEVGDQAQQSLTSGVDLRRSLLLERYPQLIDAYAEDSALRARQLHV